MNSAGTSRQGRKIVVLNPKGGSGKTTISTNLAACLSAAGHPTALMDYDPQGSSLRWLSKRPAELPTIHGIAAARLGMQATRSWQLRAPEGTRYIVVDTPAAIPAHQLVEFTRDADAVLVPVGPSDIDMHAASRFIADLLLVAKVNRRSGMVGVVANRVRERTVAYPRLMLFLQRLSIPQVTVLRDSQNYVHAAEAGMGIHDFKPYRVEKDLAQWIPLLRWVENRGAASGPLQVPSPPGQDGLSPQTTPHGQPPDMATVPAKSASAS